MSKSYVSSVTVQRPIGELRQVELVIMSDSSSILSDLYNMFYRYGIELPNRPVLAVKKGQSMKLNSGVTEVSVRVTSTIDFKFPVPPEGEEWPKCPAHGQIMCIWCARNPDDCDNGDGGGCGFWSLTGMHWDTCPNRIRGDF